MIADTGGHSVTEQYIMAERDSLPAFFIPNRSLGLIVFWFFRRVDFVWLLMSNGELLQFKNKQKMPYKEQKTASCSKISHSTT